MDPEAGKIIGMTLTNNKSALSSPLLATAVSSPTPTPALSPSLSLSSPSSSTNVSTSAVKVIANDPYLDIVEDDCTDLEYYSKSLHIKQLSYICGFSVPAWNEGRLLKHWEQTFLFLWSYLVRAIFIVLIIFKTYVLFTVTPEGKSDIKYVSNIIGYFNQWAILVMVYDICLKKVVNRPIFRVESKMPPPMYPVFREFLYIFIIYAIINIIYATTVTNCKYQLEYPSSYSWGEIFVLLPLCFCSFRISHHLMSIKHIFIVDVMASAKNGNLLFLKYKSWAKYVENRCTAHWKCFSTFIFIAFLSAIKVILDFFVQFDSKNIYHESDFCFVIKGLFLTRYVVITIILVWKIASINNFAHEVTEEICNHPIDSANMQNLQCILQRLVNPVKYRVFEYFVISKDEVVFGILSYAITLTFAVLNFFHKLPS